jgi:hypothetical protein
MEKQKEPVVKRNRRCTPISRWCAHQRFRKEFAASSHLPHGNSVEFKKCIGEADAVKLAELVKIIGMLLQNEVHSFRSASGIQTDN